MRFARNDVRAKLRKAYAWFPAPRVLVYMVDAHSSTAAQLIEPSR